MWCTSCCPFTRSWRSWASGAEDLGPGRYDSRALGRRLKHPTRSTIPAYVCEVRPRKDKRGFDLISDALRFGRLWYCEPADAIDYAKLRSRSPDAVIRVHDESGNVIETHEHKGDFKEW